MCAANGQADGQKGAAIRAWYSHGANLNSVLVGNEDIHPVGPFSVDDIIYHMDGAPTRPISLDTYPSMQIESREEMRYTG